MIYQKISLQEFTFLKLFANILAEHQMLSQVLPVISLYLTAPEKYEVFSPMYLATCICMYLFV